MNNNYIYIANWKEYLSYQQALLWCTQHAADIKRLAQTASLVICPDYVALPPCHQLLGPDVFVGAQNCSAFGLGAHTGEVSAQSIKQAGASYCILGHSERRTQAHETIEQVSKKIDPLLQHHITPIICLTDAYAIELPALLSAIRSATTDNPTKIIVAYEPVDAIGSGTAASAATITTAVQAIKKMISCHNHLDASVLYGGSVSSKNIHELKKIACLDGFLIGRASTDFQELKKIVELI